MRKGRWIIMTAVMTCAILSFAFGLSSSQQVFKNHLKTGSVQVKITEFERLNGEIRPIRGDSLDMADVADGQVVSYIPRVTTTSDDCYVRLNVSIMGSESAEGKASEDDEGVISIPVNDETIQGVGEEWVRKGSSFYCKKIMKAGDEQDPFEGILVPAEMDNIKKIHIDVSADAIQSMNVDPVFSAAKPWEQTEKNEVNWLTVQQNDAYSVVFRQNEEVECASTDLFDNFNTFMPGDLKTGQLHIQNETGYAEDVYLRTDAEDRELLQRMTLQIRCGGKTVYNGSLLSSELRENVKIASLPDGDGDDLQFALTLPAETDNRFVKAQEDVDWILSIQNAEQEDPGSEQENPGSKQEDPDSEQEQVATPDDVEQQDPDNRNDAADSSDGTVKTGDRILPMMIAAGVMTLAIIALILAMAFGRRRE